MMFLLVVLHLVALFAQIPDPVLPPLPPDVQNIVPENAEALTELGLFDEWTRAAIFSPDGTMIAVAHQFQDSDWKVWVFRLADQQPISYMTAEMGGFFNTMAWSPDSTRLAVASNRLAGGGTEFAQVYTYTIALGADRNFYTFSNTDATVYYIIYGTADSPDMLGTYPNPVRLAWSPDGTMLAIAFYDRFDVYDVTTGTQRFSTMLEAVRAVQWSLDGRYIVTTAAPDRINRVQIWGVP